MDVDFLMPSLLLALTEVRVQRLWMDASHETQLIQIIKWH